MSEYGSYIDDSFSARPWPELAQPVPGPGYALYDCDRPREGHWEVTSTVDSYIDDRCPTAYGYPTISNAEGNVTKLDPDLVQKLARATAAEKIATIKAITANDVTKAPRERGSVRITPGEVQEPKQRHFVVPGHVARKANIAVKQPAEYDSRNDEQLGAGIAAEAALFLPKARPPRITRPKSTTGPYVDHGSGSNTGERKVRILSKHGEEIFIELPTATGVSSRPSQQRKPDTHDWKEKSEQIPEPPHQPLKYDKKTATKPQGGHEQVAPQGGKKEAKQRNKQQKQQQHHQKIKPESEADHIEEAADCLMSGGLPPRSKASSYGTSVAFAPKCSVHSKASNAGSAISLKILSIAHKIASIPPGSNAPIRVPSVRQPTPIAPQSGWVEIGQGRTGSATVSDQGSRHTKVGTNYRPPSVHSVKSSSTILHCFGGSAFDVFDDQHATSKLGSHASDFRQPSAPHRAASVAATSQFARSGCSGRGSQAVPATPPITRSASHASHQAAPAAKPKSPSSFQHSFHAASDFRVTGPTPPASVRASNRASRIGSDESPRPSSNPSGQGSAGGQQQTKFAGTGWISPHPLSVAPTEIASPPQSVVHLPGESFDDPGATLTYDEWKAQRDDAATVASSQHIYMVPSISSGQKIALSQRDPAIPIFQGQSVHAALQRSQQRCFNADQAWASSRSASVHASHHSESHLSIEPHQRSHHSRHHSASNGHVPHVSQRPSVLAQDAGWDFSPQVDGSASDLAKTSYNIGLTLNELNEYNGRLGGTISHHSAQLSRVQREQQPAHPDCSSWTRRNSRYPRASSQQGSPSEKPQTQLPMPWDAPASDTRAGSDRSLRPMLHTPAHSTVHESARLYHHSLSQYAQSHHSQLSNQAHTLDVVPSKHTSSASTVRLMSRVPSDSHGSARSSPSIGSQIRQDRASSLRSAGSVSHALPMQSEATYGTRNWQQLEDAEQGRGGFQSYRMW